MNLKTIQTIGLSAAATFFVGSIAHAQEYDVRLGSIFAPGVPIVKCGAMSMAESTSLQEAGIDVSVIHSAQLGSENQLAEQVSTGQLELAPITSSILAAWVEDLAVFETYYLYENVDQAMNVYETDTAQELLDELLEVANIRVIGKPWLYGERHVFGNVKINGPEDLEGLRMRVPETFISIEGAKSLGAEPTPVAYAELYLALQQGIVEAAEAPLSVIEAESFDEPSDYVNLTGHLITAQPFIVNEGFWQGLTEKQQEALDNAATQASKNVRECVAEADAAALEGWKEDDSTEVVEDIDVEAIREASQAFFSEGFPFSETYVNLLEELK